MKPDFTKIDLKLDEPLAPYLPKDMTEGDPRFQQITARFVLSHRTGFPNWPGDGKPLTIHFTPGEKFSYSGSGMVFLQKAALRQTCSRQIMPTPPPAF